MKLRVVLVLRDLKMTFMNSEKIQETLWNGLLMIGKA
jgi:hypothetical protein